MSDAPEYLFEASSKPSLPIRAVPLIIASDETLEGYGYLVDDPNQCEVEIVQWPAQGWRSVDAGTGDEGGTVEGIFHCHWDGDILMGRNDAVAGHYVLGWSQDPQQAQTEQASAPREQVLLWHMNYHPDGGQMFFPLQAKPFVVPLALPGDDLTPDKVVAFWCDGSKGLYIHPNIWHEGIFPCLDKQSFQDRQGKVHARVSCNLGEEFGCYLGVPLPQRAP
jgi:hypothetical protein